MTTKWIVPKKGIALVDYQVRPVSGNTGLINHYNEMIMTARENLGKHTDNDVLITEKLIDKLRERRNELINRKCRQGV